MDIQLSSQTFELKLPKKQSRWNYDEESQLIHLIEVDNKAYTEVAQILNRSLRAVQHRYSIIRQRDLNAAVTWTAELDAAVIDGRRCGLNTKQIGQEIGIPDQAVQSRWQVLKAKKKVPEDVLVKWRRKKLREFTQEEDEAILRLYIQGKDDKEIAQRVVIHDKSQTEIITRRRKLVGESSPIYRRLLSMHEGTWNGDEDSMKIDALAVAVG